MSFEKKEATFSKQSGAKVKTLTFSEAIEMGEYNPEYLANFPE